MNLISQQIYIRLIFCLAFYKFELKEEQRIWLPRLNKFPSKIFIMGVISQEELFLFIFHDIFITFILFVQRSILARSTTTMGKKKRIVLIAHDNMKMDLLEWAKYNKESLGRNELYATGTTGQLLSRELGLPVIRFKSGPLGGDQQAGAKIADGLIDFLIFFWDPLEPLPHDPDIRALLRIAMLYNIPVACNRATADFIISSPLMSEEYNRLLLDFSERMIKVENGKLVLNT